MKNINSLILVFALAFTLFFIGPAFLGSEFAPYPLMTMGDALDFLTPIVLMPIYYLIFRAVRNDKNPVGLSITFVILSAIWVEGQGMHLAANAIGHHLSELSLTDAYKLTYFIDEVFSHHLWHLGVVGMALFLLYAQWKNPYVEPWKPGGAVIFAVLLHGFTLFLIFVEGQTCKPGAFICALILIVVTIWGRKKLKSQTIIFFFSIACGIALFLIASWGIYWGRSCPEFSTIITF